MIQGGCSPRAADDLFEGLTALGEEQLTKNVYRNTFTTTPITLEEFAREIFAPAYDLLIKEILKLLFYYSKSIFFNNS